MNILLTALGTVIFWASVLGLVMSMGMSITAYFDDKAYHPNTRKYAIISFIGAVLGYFLLFLGIMS
jgi:hypothetical protein